jgi:hypothetical protein
MLTLSALTDKKKSFSQNCMRCFWNYQNPWSISINYVTSAIAHYRGLGWCQKTQHQRKMQRCRRRFASRPSHFNVDEESARSYSTPLGRRRFQLGCSSLASIQVHDLLVFCSCAVFWCNLMPSTKQPVTALWEESWVLVALYPPQSASPQKPQSLIVGNLC